MLPFISIGDGIGYNVIHKRGLQLGAAINHLGHLPTDNPLVEHVSGHVVALSFDYSW
jgi:hypothetical protein